MKIRDRISRVFLRLLALLFICVVSSFCTPLALADEETTLRVALYPYVPERKALFFELEAIFENSHPGVNVELVETPEWISDYYKGGAEETRADVYELDTILLSDFVLSGRVAELSSVPYQDFLPEAFAAVQRDGKTYAVPHWICGNFLFYRTGDMDIETAATWADLLNRLEARGESILVDYKGSSTLGEWYLTILASLKGMDAAQIEIMGSITPDDEVVAVMRRILQACPTGYCRSEGFHHRIGFYAREFARGRAATYVGYSETLHHALSEIIEDCTPTSGCLRAEEIAVRPLPPIEVEGAGMALGWVDGLALDAGLEGEKKVLALEFVEFAVSEEAYGLVLGAEWGTAPRYLLPARRLRGDEFAPLYPALYDAHRDRATATIPGLNERLRAIGENIDCLLPIDRTDIGTLNHCAKH
jgi:thiamine pyridinylase